MADSWMAQRAAGVVLHPTSLPGPHGMGDFGPNAYFFVDWLHAAGQTLWQTLPLGPVGPGDSPYMGSSAFAGNPLLVALEPLVQRGWLDAQTLQADWDDERVDYAVVSPWRLQKLRQAFAGFELHASTQERSELAAWALSQQAWLEDYALFMALDQAYRPALWPEWPSALALRDAVALAKARTSHAREIDFWCFVQWQFELQWQAVKSYAHSKGVRLVGDLPIFVAHHSADCWARPDLYELDSTGQPQVVAGVPPDFFSDTGQRWGNPLYNWAAMARDGYQWWIERVRRQLHLADVVRIDHFRGFVDYWEIPASEPDAVRGRWQPGPGAALFKALALALGDLPIIAEDLGIITLEVSVLRERTGFPGMRVLQFAFSGDAGNAFLPHNFEPGTVVYTGTHDNDTVPGWWASCSPHERAFATHYLGIDDHHAVHWAMVRAASFSVARLSLCQFQDVLGLDSQHRMNKPGTMGCWSWRFKWDWVGADLAQCLANITAASGRTGFDRLRF
ncbi:4-alpha-glucanotransferase [Rhodoferax sp.]|uniref:4-alpha-glucanotransferase n=1 Tax=Rhodoferax sp. TaxID=50421 RepID=UPI0025EC9C3E|nr:4-alpha-glucanotransferase [Rhodoferax sp.]MCM2341798.1 4-alpha-glucanotransferase [Rhodoferax sp.]